MAVVHGEAVLRQRVCLGQGCHAVFFICTHCDRGHRHCSVHAANKSAGSSGGAPTGATKIALNPLASIEDVRRLGNTGGGDLGDVLVLFATGNHGLMRGPEGKLDKEVPEGFFSLEFPGSQGSHAGHSGILEEDPTKLDSGRLSVPDFQRLSNLAIDGLIKRSDVGRFIASNLRRDPKSNVLGASVAGLLARDLGEFVASVGPDLLERLSGSNENILHRQLEEKLTKLIGGDNLIGSSGEYGLLFAFLVNSPRTKELEGEPALCLEDIESMFVHKRLPEGWESWKKTRRDWLINTTALMASAGKAYLAPQRGIGQF